MSSIIKRAVLKVARPVWRRVGPLFYSRLDVRIDKRLTLMDVGWKQHAPAFLNAVSTVKAFGSELTQSRSELQSEIAQTQQTLREEMAQALDEMRASLATTSDKAQSALERIEFVRREIMYEMRYNAPTAGASAGVGADTSGMVTEPRILSPEKLTDAQGEGIRLNLGCGHIPLDGYVNVDMRELPGVDVVAEAGNLPFEPGTIKEIFSAHMLEHFPQEQLIRRLLPHWRSLLTPGGSFRAVTPDGEAMLAGIAAGDYPFEEFREVLFGAQEYTGDFHYNMFTPDSLRQLLEQAGFTEIQIPVKGRRNGKSFEFEISAVKA